MGHLKDVANQSNRQTFPGSTFEIAGDVPAPQCSDAQIQGDNARTEGAPHWLYDTGAFTGFDLIGDTVEITASVGGNTGTFGINGNGDNAIPIFPNPGFGDPVSYYIHDGGELILTRDLFSFGQFIHEAGYAYTIKGGKLYTNIPSEFLSPACKIAFEPLT